MTSERSASPKVELLKRLFVTSAVAILACTGAAKIFSIFGSARILMAENAVFHFPNRWVMLAAALLEIAIVGVLVRGRCDRTLRRISG
jgi:hypothetical protein